MSEGVLCQSCGMPLSIDTYGTNASGTMNLEYCNMCFQKGAFTDSELTLSQMIQISVNRMRLEMGMEEDKALAQAHSIVPTLKRWRNLKTSS